MSIFQKIINKEIPSDIVYEDDNFIAILDINPINEGHTLLIPKEKKENILKEDDEVVAKLFIKAKELSKELIKKYNAKGIKILTNVNKEAGQEIFHTHIHLIPYY